MHTSWHLLVHGVLSQVHEGTCKLSEEVPCIAWRAWTGAYCVLHCKRNLPRFAAQVQAYFLKCLCCPSLETG